MIDATGGILTLRLRDKYAAGADPQAKEERNGGEEVQQGRGR